MNRDLNYKKLLILLMAIICLVPLSSVQGITQQVNISQQKMLKYDYVYVYNSNDQLIKKYNSIFNSKKDIQSNSLYKFDKDKEKIYLVK